MLSIGQAPQGLRKREVALIIFLGLILIVASSLPTVARNVGWVFPEWSLMLVLFLAFRAGLPSASLGAFLLGCFQDSLTMSPEGLEALALILLAVVVFMASEFMKLTKFFLMVLFVALASMAKNAFFVPGFLIIMGLYPGVSPVVFVNCLVKALVTGLAAIPVLGLLDCLVGRRGRLA